MIIVLFILIKFTIFVIFIYTPKNILCKILIGLKSNQYDIGRSLNQIPPLAENKKIIKEKLTYL